MNLNQLFNDFAQVLASRTTFLTEDSVRYIFYSCMMKQDGDTEHYILEAPYEKMKTGLKNVIVTHPNNLIKSPKGKLFQQLDLLYHDPGKDETICVEVKFHRNGGATSTFAHTDAAGQIINDIRRLSLLQPVPGKKITRLFVYVTDDEMHNYLLCTSSASGLINPAFRKLLSQFYQHGGPYAVQMPPAAPKTFFEQANLSFSPKTAFSVSAKKIFARSFHNPACPVLLNGNCHISVYEI